jgi:four helix bundle protein
VVSGQWLDSLLSTGSLPVTIRSFQDLVVWQRGIELVEQVYKMTTTFPKDEVFGLRSQLRRAAVSIPSNIAEGQARHSTKEFLNFLSIARGSLAELETQLIIAGRLAYLKEEERTELLQRTAEVGRLLNGLIKSLQTDH